MFTLLHRRPPASPWRNADLAPVNTVLILATRARSTAGAVGPIFYAPTARIGWKDEAGTWTDFATGAPLDIEPQMYMDLPPLDVGKPVLALVRRGGRRWGGVSR